MKVPFKERRQKVLLSGGPVFLVLLLLILSACNVVRGSGEVETGSREVSSFNQVSLAGQGELIVTQGDRESLEIEAKENIIALVESEVRGNTLYIGLEEDTNILPNETLRFHVTMDDIAGLEVAGSGKVSAVSIEADSLSLGVFGSGDIQVDSLTADSLLAEISGSGDIETAGQVGDLVIDIGGSGQYQGADLESEVAEVEVNGSGKATVWVKDRLEIEISGSGRVDYYGSPTVNQQTSGSGSVNGLGSR